MKQPSVWMKESPGSPCPSSHTTVMKAVNTSPSGSSGLGTGCEPSISATVPTQAGWERHCFRDDLWIEEEKKRQRRMTRAAPKRRIHPLEELEEVRVTI